MYNERKQPQFIFTKKDPDYASVSITTEHETLDELLAIFEDFLRGCGFRFNGELTIQEEEP